MISKSGGTLMKKFIERSFIIGVVTTLVMVTVISIWNGTWMYGWHKQTIISTLTIVPLTFLLAMLFKELLTIPMMIKLHQQFPDWIVRLVPRHHSMPILVVTGNVTIMSIYGLYISHNYDIHHLIRSYFIQLGHTLIFAIPLLLLIVRPIVTMIFNNLWQPHDDFA